MAKVRVATMWFSGCAGCHMSLLDIDEALIDLAARIDLRNSPLTDLKVFPEDGVDVTLIEGAVANEEHLRLVRTAREKSKIIIALGDCAVTGNVPALRNGLDADRMIESIYGSPTTSNGALPYDVVPQLLGRVSPLAELIPVDYFLHGCPPPAGLIAKTIFALLDGKTPELVGPDLKFG
ncbi:MAG: oxidoreductase [Candidatus Bipolaricaulota bacterium]|nr:oxidoreductase [Candidatus Bipolaricaulota bacterium]